MKPRKEIFEKYKVEGIQDIGIIFQEKLNIEEEIRKLEEKIAKLEEKVTRDEELRIFAENHRKNKKDNTIIWADDDKPIDYGAVVGWSESKSEYGLLRGQYVKDCSSNPQVPKLDRKLKLGRLKAQKDELIEKLKEIDKTLPESLRGTREEREQRKNKERNR